MAKDREHHILQILSRAEHIPRGITTKCGTRKADPDACCRLRCSERAMAAWCYSVQEAELSRRDRAMLRVIKYFTVTQGH